MKNKSTQLTLKSLAMFVGIIGLTLFLFSCAKGGSDNNHNNNIGTVYPGCVNCNSIANGQMFFTSQSNSLSGEMTQLGLNLTFTGSLNYANYGSSPITAYSGPVYAQGQLTVTSSTMYGCVIPPGTYTVQTMQSGNWYYGTVQNLTMQIVGLPFQIQVQAQVASTGATGQTWAERPPVGRLFGKLNILNNNMLCSDVFIQ